MMNPFRKKSDREVVDALRRTERFRRPAGLALIVLGLAFAGFAIWGTKSIEHKVLSIVDGVSAHRPVPAELRDISAMLAYTMGLHSGLLLSQGAFFGAAFLGLGLRLSFGGRKARLLIQHFDSTTNGQALPKA